MNKPLDQERALLERFREAEVASKAELGAQLDIVEIVGQDNDPTGGYLHLRVADNAPRIAVPADFPISAMYDDSDGMQIDILLHMADGKINSLEWYRVDGQSPKAWPPADPSLVRVQYAP